MVRLFLLTAYILVCSLCCFGQETIVLKRKLTDAVKEKITVLKSDINVKQGLYQAIIGKNIALATGSYDHNKKVGLWHFFNPQGQLIQNFDYTHNKLTYEAQDTSSTFHYAIYAPETDSTSKKDSAKADNFRIVRPIRIGGQYYGYIPYLRLFRLPKELYGIDTDKLSVIVELLVSPMGRLAEYKVRLQNFYLKKVYTVDINQLSDEDKTFIPASLDNKPIMCQIFITCFMSADGQIDFE